MNGDPAQRTVEQGKTLIVGLGRTGLSCARYIAARGIPAAVTDTREQPPGLQQLKRELPDTALFLGGFDPAVFAAAERLVVSPGVAVSEPLIQAAMARGVPVLGDIELFAQAVNAPVAAITGSNGKSTVTSLLGEMAQAAAVRVKVGGNLGEPALDLLEEGSGLYLLELSSFQLETTFSLKPRVACVLNISPDHLDRYSSFQSYIEAKAKIYHQAEVRVFNRDDPRVMAMSRGEGGELFFSAGEPEGGDFGLRKSAGVSWLAKGKELLLPVAELPAPGRHNQVNALAALAMGTALDLPMPSMLLALRRFHGLPHRTQFIVEHEGVRWFNDSKGTNPGATLAALEGLRPERGGARTVLIAGGDAKGADFEPLTSAVERSARAVVLIGRDAPLIEQVLAGSVPLLNARDLDEAVALAAEQALPGDTVLLSPACASFDMFRNYQQRGDLFVAAVKRLTQ